MKTIFERLHSGETVPMNDPDFQKIHDIVMKSKPLLVELNNAVDFNRVRALLSKITQSEIDQSTTIFTPFHTNLGIFTIFGKNVFINHDCSFLDIGGITIDDGVMIGPKVKLITEGHPLDATTRHSLYAKPIHLHKNAWIGAGATILPGVNIGENSMVAADSLVLKDVPPNTVVAGIPAKIIKEL